MAMPCPIPGCSSRTRPGQLLCGPHWSMVPTEFKGRVWSTWRGFTKAKDHQTILAARQPYLDARAAAISHVANAQAPLL